MHVAARRANKLLAIITAMENDEEENAFRQWVDEDFLDSSDLQISFDNSEKPVYGISDVMKSPWEGEQLNDIRV